MNPLNKINEIKIDKVDDKIIDIYNNVNASKRLIAHLLLVHDVSLKLIKQFNLNFPEIKIDNEKISNSRPAFHGYNK